MGWYLCIDCGIISAWGWQNVKRRYLKIYNRHHLNLQKTRYFAEEELHHEVCDDCAKPEHLGHGIVPNMPYRETFRWCFYHDKDFDNCCCPESESEVDISENEDNVNV